MASILPDLTSAVTSSLSKLPSEESIQDAERMELLGAIDQLRAALEPPMVSLQKLSFGHYDLVSVRIAQGMGVFDAFAGSEGKELTVTELLAKTKGDEQLLVRIMRYLCCIHIFKETAKGTYQPLPTAMILANGGPPADFIKHLHGFMSVSGRIYDYFESKGYQNPGDSYDAPFQYGRPTIDHYFDWLTKHPAEQQLFNSAMGVGRQFRGEDWFDYYPVLENLQGSPDRTLLVDIGGGVGHDVIAFHKKFGQLPGKLVVQDLPRVIDDIKAPLPAGIEAIKHNMFNPQPIKGAKTYYMRTLLHDWPDKYALQALARTREAMAPDSVLIINETTLPDTDVPKFSASLDIHMMEVFGSHERTEKQWVELVEQAGLKVVKVWRPRYRDIRSNAAIEATLK